MKSVITIRIVADVSAIVNVKKDISRQRELIENRETARRKFLERRHAIYILNPIGHREKLRNITDIFLTFDKKLLIFLLVINVLRNNNEDVIG